MSSRLCAQRINYQTTKCASNSAPRSTQCGDKRRLAPTQCGKETCWRNVLSAMSPRHRRCSHHTHAHIAGSAFACLRMKKINENLMLLCWVASFALLDGCGVFFCVYVLWCCTAQQHIDSASIFGELLTFGMSVCALRAYNAPDNSSAAAQYTHTSTQNTPLSCIPVDFNYN